MKRTLLLSAFFLLNAPAYAKAKVFILAGQSNMAGGGDVSGMTLDIDDHDSPSQVSPWRLPRSLTPLWSRGILLSQRWMGQISKPASCRPSA